VCEAVLEAVVRDVLVTAGGEGDGVAVQVEDDVLAQE
jgi:hypothetical protein